MIKVMIVDDMKILRECLKMVIEQDDNFTVVACAANGREAVEMSMLYIPDIILMDLNMPIYSGHDAIKDIKTFNNAIKILVLSVDGDEKNITRAFQNGADGYVLKNIDPMELFAAMKKAFKGEKYVQENAFSIGNETIKVEQNQQDSNVYLRVEFTEEREMLWQ